ncbi:J domain-containing protein [Acidicapsa acidisoli]|uniref:J domain-containing protein n=1 Tax=Acidicapsa acidisoli TaxID=1615681 RepID=UPI0021E0C6FE|nr:J domain-containing protein [Acidicapsa acidisoli]
MKPPNHYEFLQISPNAEQDTIHRVYRFLATRLHPDNPETGDADKFFQLKQAYDVLSNPTRRAAYDTAWQTGIPEPEPLSTSIDFMDDKEGELNRRLAVLAMLYIRRRTTPESPEVSLYEVEARMGFPREYLDFTIWYLQKKGYIARADNAQFTLTVDGVDFVETQRMSTPILQKLLTSATEPYSTDQPRSDQPAEPVESIQSIHARGNGVGERRSRGERRKRSA